MTETPDLYPDGTPVPPRAVRLQVLLELVILLTLTGLYLGFNPHRPLLLDVGMALVGMGLVGLLARETSQRLWGTPASPEFERIRRCTAHMLTLTVPAVAALFLFGAVDGFLDHRDEGIGAALQAVFLKRLFRPTFFVCLIFYSAFGWVQQALFQFYLLARLRALLPYASPYLLAALNGTLYGLVHVSSGDFLLTFLTMACGVVWSYSYYRDRYLLPLALSHAALGATYFYWGWESDVVGKLLAPIAT